MKIIICKSFIVFALLSLWTDAIGVVVASAAGDNNNNGDENEVTGSGIVANQNYLRHNKMARIDGEDLPFRARSLVKETNVNDHLRRSTMGNSILPKMNIQEEEEKKKKEEIAVGEEVVNYLLRNYVNRDLKPKSKPDYPKLNDYGEKCEEDADCANNQCIIDMKSVKSKSKKESKTCGCKSQSDCWGCGADGFVCLRVEKPGPFGNLTVCDMVATYQSNMKKPMKVFGAGGSYTEYFDNFRYMGQGHTKDCSAFSPYLNPDIKMPPAFAQINLNAMDMDDVGIISIDSVDLDSLIDNQVFLNRHWIKTLDVSDRTTPKSQTSEKETKSDRKLKKKDKPYKIVNYPRVTVPSLAGFKSTTLEDNRMYEVWIKGSDKESNTLDFSLLHESSGVEFLGVNDGATIYIEGDLMLEGRISFKNLTVDFDLGTLELDPASSLIFQWCYLVGVDRCPERYIEIDDVCYFVNPINEQAKDGEETCSDEIPRGFHPSYGSLGDTAALADVMLSGEEEVWISPYGSEGIFNPQTCTRLDSFGNKKEYSGDECDDYSGVLCAVDVTEFVLGRNYTSYFSDQLWPDWYQASRRLVDSERLPVQTGATLTISQTDYRDTPGDDVEYFTVTDQRPTAVKVVVHLAEGDASSISVALDSLPGASTAGNNIHEWNFSASDALPSRLQVHTTSEYVCISQVDLALRNETGSDHVAVSIKSTIFESCYDYNVCNSATPSCSRSLMYYDNEKGCAVLDVGNPLVPRDLTFDLFGFSCGRLTTWNAVDLGDNFTVEIITSPENADVLYLSEGLLHLHETNSDDHHYAFDPPGGVTSFVLQESNKLPYEFTLTDGAGAIVTSVKIQRYNLTILEADFSILWGCINLCNATATPSGVMMEKIETVYLSLLETVECNKIPTLFAVNDDNETLTGREICSSPLVDATNVDDLKRFLNDVQPSSYPYRTIQVNVVEDTFDLSDDNTIVVPPNRGMNLFKDDVVLNNVDAIFCNISFVVRPSGELFLEDFELKGLLDFMVERDRDASGVLEISGCRVETTTETFISNYGSTTLETCILRGESMILNNDQGELDMTYVDFQSSFRLSNSLTGTITFSRMTLYEDFPYPSTSLIGTILLPDADRFYSRVDEDEDPLCGNTEPLDTEQMTSVPDSECRAKCEDLFVCSGYLSLFREEDSQVQCLVCKSEEACEFNCNENPSTSYAVAASNFHFFRVFGACPINSREYQQALTDVSIEDCKLYCSYYQTCEGFRVENIGNGSEVTRQCILYADLDFKGDCMDESATALANETIYLPFVGNSAVGYQPVQGTLLNDARLLGIIPGILFDKCSVMCTKTLDCLSFVQDGNDCFLYDSNLFRFNDAAEASNTTGLFVSVSSIFPKNRYTKLESCRLSDHYDSFNAKTLRRCRDRCDGDRSCVSFIYDKFENLEEDNCFIYSRTAVIDTVFPEVPTCDEETELVDVYLAYMKETFTSSLENDRFYDEPAGVINAEFVVDRSLLGYLLDECKSLCLQEQSCVALRHNAATFTCEIGSGVLNPFSNSSDVFLALEARPADILSTYVALPGICDYDGEKIDITPVHIPEESSGYARIPRVCQDGTSTLTSTGAVMTASECGLACDQETSCQGFVYFPDYGTGVNEGKVGTCDLISDGQLSFNKCNNVTLSDVYLRGDGGSICPALCNVHHLCSFFTFDGTECKLYSDLTIYDECSDDTVINIGLKYRERDALVKAEGQCLIEYESLRSKGCFVGSDGVDYENDEDLQMQATGNPTDGSTPFACQQACRNLQGGFSYYAIGNIDTCYCSNVDISSLLESCANCTNVCSGDSSQLCGGSRALHVGSSGLPRFHLTLSQCKKACIDDPYCSAIVYDDSAQPASCTLSSSAAFQVCDANSVMGTTYIESLEHYYQEPTLPFRGSKVIYKFTASALSCQRICDAFNDCEAIKVIEENRIDNCEILGGDVVPLGNGTENNVLVANDVTLFTKASFLDPPEGREALLATFESIFDLDECRALCDEHVECGSLTFASRTCALYRFTSFGTLNLTANNPYYVGYLPYLVNRQDFTEADNLCLAGEALELRVTTQSVYQCADLCRATRGCIFFTYEVENQQNCNLYDETAGLFACTVSDTKTYVMYNLGKFTYRENGFLKDEDAMQNDSVTVTFSDKSVAACSALCDEYFFCRSFRFESDTGSCTLFTSEQFFTGPNATTSSNGDLYTYFSDFLYARLPQGLCVQSTPLVTLFDTQVEACKKICYYVDACVSFALTSNGDCNLYSTSDFSLPCAEDASDEILYIGTEYIFTRPEFAYEGLSSCFDVKGLDAVALDNVTDCQDLCSENITCFGLQFENGPPSYCYILTGYLPPFNQACDGGVAASFRTKSNPYHEMKSTCLRHNIEFENSIQILDTEEYECMALCDAHPYCRYFVYGTDPDASFPELRECILFKAQSEELDDCEDYSGKFLQRTAFVNGRTFIDQYTWFGEPEETFAVIEGLSYQECASLCDSLTDVCNAFLHTWNYRRDSSATGEPLIFTKTRLIKADFAAGDEALFLSPDFKNNRILVRSAATDDDVRKQAVVLEDEGEITFRVDTTMCISGGAFVAINDTFVLDTLEQNDESGRSPVPRCQELEFKKCSSDDGTVLEFESIENGDRLSLNYSIAGIPVGCLRGMRNPSFDFSDTTPNGDRDYELIDGAIQSLDIDAIELCDPTVTLDNKTVICKLDEGSNSSAGPWNELSIVEESDGDCSLDASFDECAVESAFTDEYNVSVLVCTNYTRTEMVFEQNETVPEQNETVPEQNETVPEQNISSSTWRRTTTVTKTQTNESCTTTQKTGIDLLEEMFSFYANDASCFDAPIGNRAFARAYGVGGCGFDDGYVKIPSELFALASDPVILLNRDVGGCLQSDLMLGPCQHTESRTKWVYIFNGGELFYVDDEGIMMCLTRNDMGNEVYVTECDSTNANLSENQSFSYSSLLGQIVSDGSCLACQLDNTCKTVENCNATGTRFAQFSECMLNSYSTTVDMKLESVERSDYCIPSGQTKAKLDDLVSCEGTSAGWFKYYYKSGETAEKDASRLELVNSSSLCFGKVGPILGEEKDLSEFETGLTHCSDISNAAEKLYWRMNLGGENNNVLRWNTNFPDTYYCYDIPQKAQQECHADNATLISTGDAATTWRQYGSAGDDTAISVRPELLLTEITDPELLYQFWLYSSDGKQSRILRARTAVLQRDVGLLLPLIASANEAVADGMELINSVEQPIDELNDKLSRGESFFELVSIILIPFERIPYVGNALEAMRLRPTSKTISKACKNGSKGVGKLDTSVGKAKVPISQFSSAIEALNDKLGATMVVLGGLVEYMTRASFCSSINDNFNDEYDRLQEWISTLLSGVTNANTFIGELDDLLSGLDSFPNFMNTNVFGVFRRFNKILDRLNEIISSLSFIEYLDDFGVKIPKPKVKWFWFKLKWKGTYNITIRIVGKTLKKIEGIIKHIPGLGSVLNWLKDKIGSIIRAIFDFFEIKLPNFGIEFDFIDEFKASMIKTISDIFDGIDDLLSMVSLNGLLDVAALDFVNNLMGLLPSDLLPGVDLECDNSSTGICLPSGLGVDIDFVSGSLPKMKFDNFSIELPDIGIGYMDRFLGLADSWSNVWDTLLDAGVECDEYVTVPFNPVEFVSTSLNVNTSALGMPECGYNLKVCSKINLPGIDLFQEAVAELLAEAFELNNTSTDRRRRLQTSWELLDEEHCGTNAPMSSVSPHGWGIAVPIPIPFKLISIMSSKIIPLENMRRHERGLDQKWYGSAPERFAVWSWKQYWKKQLGFLPYKWPKMLPDALSLNLLDLSTNIIFGCNEKRFQVKFWTGPAIEFGFNTFSILNWKNTNFFNPDKDLIGYKYNEATKEVETDYKEFDKQVNALVIQGSDFADFKCKFQFVESTYKAYLDREKNSDFINGDYAIRLSDLMNENKNNGIKDRIGTSTDLYFEKLAFDRDFKDLSQILEKDFLPLAINARADFQVRYSALCNRRKYLKREWKWPVGIDPPLSDQCRKPLDSSTLSIFNVPDARYIFREYLDSSCAGPMRYIRTPNLNPSEFTTDTAKAKIKSFIREFSSSDRGSKRSTWGFHPSEYGNLFGAGFGFTVARQQISAEMEKEELGFSFPLVGPLPGVYTGGSDKYVEETYGVKGSKLFADIPFINWFFSIIQYGLERFETSFFVDGKDPPKSVEEGIKELQDKGTQWEQDLPIAKRWGVRFDWSFGELYINAREDEPETSKGFYSPANCWGPTCVAIGFDKENFV